MQEFLLQLLERASSRTTGVIYMGVGLCMTLLDYLYANPKPAYFLTPGLASALFFVGVFTITARTLERWKKDFEKRRKDNSWLRERSKRIETAAVENVQTLPKIELQVLLWHLKEGKQRIHVQHANRLMMDMLLHHVFLETDQIGEAASPGMYVVNPALWARREQILKQYENVAPAIHDYRGSRLI